MDVIEIKQDKKTWDK